MSTPKNSVKKSLIFISFTSVLLFSGCQVGPDYAAPEYSVPDQWHQQAVSGLEDGSADLQTWWTVFGDPVLENLIQRSCESNLSLHIAYGRVMESRAVLGVASGQYWPGVDGVGFYSRDRVSKNGLQAPADRSTPDPTNLYGVGVDASWEIDVFGGGSKLYGSSICAKTDSICSGQHCAPKRHP